MQHAPFNLSKSYVIPTKRSAWRDLFSHNIAGRYHYLSISDQIVEKSLVILGMTAFLMIALKAIIMFA